MPLPEIFFDANYEEVTLDQLCVLEPHWAANRIRTLTDEVDKLRQAQQSNPADGYQGALEAQEGA